MQEPQGWSHEPPARRVPAAVRAEAKGLLRSLNAHSTAKRQDGPGVEGALASRENPCGAPSKDAATAAREEGPMK